jgi:hypothetical protein
LIVASLDHIVALPAGIPTEPAAITAPFTKLYEFPEGTEDLEALEIVEGNIYAISENKVGADGSDESDIISFAWTPEGTLNVTNRWRVKVSNAVSNTRMAQIAGYENSYVSCAHFFAFFAAVQQYRREWRTQPIKTGSKIHICWWLANRH